MIDKMNLQQAFDKGQKVLDQNEKMKKILLRVKTMAEGIRKNETPNIVIINGLAYSKLYDDICEVLKDE